MRLPQVVLAALLLVLSAAVFPAAPAAAQDGALDPGLDGPGFSARIFSDDPIFGGAGPGLSALGAPRPLNWSLTGLLVGSDELTAGGAVFGYNNTLGRNKLPWSLSFGFQSLNPDGNDGNLEQYSLGYQQTLHWVPGRFALVLSAGYKDLRDIRQSYSAGLSGEFALSERFSLTGSAGWAANDFEGGNRVDDIVPSVEVGYAFRDGKVNASLEYTFDNDVSGADYGGALSFTLPGNTAFIVGGAKDDVYLARYRVRF